MRVPCLLRGRDGRRRPSLVGPVGDEDGVNFDPANFLINGHDPVKSAVAFAGRVRHVNARDAQARTASGGAKEVPVGDGDIDWLVMLATLESVEYRDFVVVDQDNGTDRWPDVLAGVKFLRRFVPAS